MSKRKQRVLFTALPNGVNPETGRFRLSVHVSPRLKHTDKKETTLGAWAPWTAWPARFTAANPLRFTVHVLHSGGTVEQVPAVRVSPDPRLDLWQKLFPSDMRVVSAKVPEILNDKPIFDFGTGEILDALVDKYAESAKDLTPPRAGQLAARYAEFDVLGTRQGATRDALFSIFQRAKNQGVTGRSPANLQKSVLQMMVFQAPTTKPGFQALNKANTARRAGLARARRAQQTRPPLGVVDFLSKTPYLKPVPPRLDFHSALSGLGGHPQLMRLLGLVIDLEFDTTIRGNSRVWVTPEGSLAIAGDQMKTPHLRTHAVITSESFRARPTPQDGAYPGANSSAYPPREIADGMLDLRSELSPGKPAFRLEQVDIDAVGAQTVAAVNQAVKATKDGKGEQTQAPPGFRTAGLTVIRTERGRILQAKLVRQRHIYDQTNRQDVHSVDLYAEDVTRGYAYDVFDVESGRWYSLCEREGSATFTADGTVIELGPEEGWVGGAITQSVAKNDDAIKAPEPIASWANNWSMVTQRPGRTIDPDEKPVDYEPQAGADVKLAVKYETPVAAPGQPWRRGLPPQRFGRDYMVRARAVDLAGNRLSLEEADGIGDERALGPVTFQRHEPIQSPAVVMRKPVTEGESPDRLVIRSDPNDAPSPSVNNERHVLPPAIDPIRAELHGALDAEDGPRASAYAMLVARANGALDERDGDGYKHAGAAADPGNFGRVHYDIDKPVFQVENGILARVPWLPDPASTGLYIRGVPGAEGGGWSASWFRGAREWPDVQPIRLHVYESAEFVAPQLVQGANDPGDEPYVLRVGLPKAEDVTLQLSSQPFDNEALYGVWKMVAQHAGLSPTVLEQLWGDVVEGRHWAFTPGRELRIVHAVPRPLRPTTFRDGDSGPRLTLLREPGQTFVTLSDRMRTSRKSTERVDVHASWLEVHDHMPADGGEWQPELLVPSSALACQVKVELDPANDEELEVEERHELRHTKHVPEIHYTTEATSRFTEYFAKRRNFDFTPSGPAFVDLDDAGVVEGSEVVTNRGGEQPGTITFTRGSDYEIDYESGRLTDLGRPNTRMGAVSIKYLPREVVERSPAPVVRRALSSARPAPPKVLYAVPTFKRERESYGSVLRANHEPAGLRVYLERPWWSSGAGELLGVIGLPDNHYIPPRHAELISQRGQDPLWGSAPVSSQLIHTEEFRAAVERRNDVELPEMERDVTVAGHVVRPDTERGLWYCDIDILPGSAYTPFIRLGLARFQPHAIPGVELSQVVPLDFMQLYPGRTMSVVAVGSNHRVTVTGRSYRSRRIGADVDLDVSSFEAILQQRRPQTPDGDDAVGWEAVPGSEPVPMAPEVDSDGIVTWTGFVDTAGTSGRRRIVVREYERFDDGAGGTARRPVFTEAIEI